MADAIGLAIGWNEMIVAGETVGENLGVAEGLGWASSVGTRFYRKFNSNPAIGEDQAWPPRPIVLDRLKGPHLDQHTRREQSRAR